MGRVYIKRVNNRTVSTCCKYIGNLFLVTLLVWPDWKCLTQSVAKQDVVMQIIVPYQSSAMAKYDKTHVYAKERINRGREKDYSNLRDHFEINSWLNYTERQTPTEILTLFCTEIFSKHVNTILSLNRGSGTESSNNYILQLAEYLGYPVISWDPNYPGALQSIEESRVLQIAPTIYHQCQGMTRILQRYNWTEFAIVTSKITSHSDFINCMRDMVKQTSTRQGYIVKARFKLLTSITIDIDEYDDWEDTDTTIKLALQEITRSVSRVVLLHAEGTLALDIMSAAEDMGLTEAKYMWILSSSSVGGIGRYAKFPIGTLGIMYNDTETVIEQAMKTSIRLWALGLEQIASNPSMMNTMKMFPTNTCNSSKQTFWKDGSILYRAMKSVVIDDHPPVSFSDNGVIEHVELKIYNVRPAPSKTRRPMRRWDLVGSMTPKKKGDRIDMDIEMDEIVWPGGAVFPPKGKPDKRFFRFVTLDEPPYIEYVPPIADNQCSTHAIPCKLNRIPNEYGNATIDKDGMVNYCCTGLCIDLLKILAEKMAFDYEVFEVEDRKWGIQGDNGEWTGLPKAVLENKADMVITSIKINYQRATAMDFSTPFLETGITIMVALRKGAISATAFLEPFDRQAWLLIMALSIPVVASAIFTTEWFSPAGLNRGKPYAKEPYDYPSWCLILVFSVHATGASIFIFEWMSPSGLNKGQTPLREHKFSLFRSFWMIWAMLFGASVTTDNPRGMSSRFLANVWALFALVFLASYTANLAAFMITIDEYYDLTGIRDWRLLNPTAVTPHFRFATIPGGSTEDNIRKNYPRMQRYMQKYNKSSVPEGIVALKRAEIHAFIYDATVLEYNAGRDPECDLITVGKWYAMTGYGIGFPKGSPYIDEVNTIILELQKNGELDRLQKFWLAGACHARKDKKDKTSHNIGILNFTSAFILLAGGVLLGTILLLLEHCYFKFGRKCLKKYDKSGCCSLVSLSMGKSLTFEQSVMDAIDFHKRHRCKDPLCETQLWKAKHELDLALIKLDRLKTELTAMDDHADGKTTQIATIEPTDVKTTEPNGTSTSQTLAVTPSDSHYEIPKSVRMRPNNNIDQHTIGVNGKSDNYSIIDNKKQSKDIELSEVDKRRQQFRRSPSYTNAMSTDSDGKDGGSSNGKAQSHSTCVDKTDKEDTAKDAASPKRASYSQAVEDSPLIGAANNDSSPKQNTRTRFYDGKYYVGVAGDNDESAL